MGTYHSSQLVDNTPENEHYSDVNHNWPTGNTQLMSQEVSYVRSLVLVRPNSFNTVSYSLPGHFALHTMTTPYAGCNMYRGNNDKLHSSNPTHVRGRATLHEAYCVSFLRSYLIRDEPSTRSASKFYPQLIYKRVILLNCIRLYLIQNRPCHRGFPLEYRPLLSLTGLLVSLSELYYIPRFKLKFARQSSRDGRP